MYSLINIDLLTGDDSEMLSGSRGTSPVDSNHSGNTEAYEVTDSEAGDAKTTYEVTDSEDDDVQEVPAESAEAQLSK